jgi:uncharacterized protein YndB with AHSA1/START domain
MNVEPNAVVRVNRRFDVPSSRVFDAWLDPAMLAKWMFGPAVRDEEIVKLTLDPRPGGAFSFIVRREGREINHLGEYLEIERPSRLAFTWSTAQSLPDVSRVTIEIVSLGDGCELTLTHEMHPDWLDYVSRTEAGWAKMLDTLAAALAA